MRKPGNAEWAPFRESEGNIWGAARRDLAMIPPRGVIACSRAARHATRALPCEIEIMAEVAATQTSVNRPYNRVSANS